MTQLLRVATRTDQAREDTTDHRKSRQGALFLPSSDAARSLLLHDRMALITWTRVMVLFRKLHQHHPRQARRHSLLSSNALPVPGSFTHPRPRAPVGAGPTAQLNPAFASPFLSRNPTRSACPSVETNAMCRRPATRMHAGQNATTWESTSRQLGAEERIAC